MVLEFLLQGTLHSGGSEGSGVLRGKYNSASGERRGILLGWEDGGRGGKADSCNTAEKEWGRGER